LKQIKDQEDAANRYTLKRLNLGILDHFGRKASLDSKVGGEDHKTQ